VIYEIDMPRHKKAAAELLLALRASLYASVCVVAVASAA
jgi:hypothetical protein